MQPDIINMPSIEDLHRENYRLELRARDGFLKKIPTYSRAELQRALGRTDRAGWRLIKRWVNAPRIVSVVHHEQLYIPKFQFQQNGRLHPIVPRLLRILSAGLNRWEIAHWFLAPNGWLDGARPINELNGNHALLLEAAKNDVMPHIG